MQLIQEQKQIMPIPRTHHLTGTLLLALFSTPLVAAPEISLSVTAEKEVVVTEESGQKVTRRIETSDTSPGDVLFYTIRYRNGGDEPAHNVLLDNRIPKGTLYLDGSAWGEGAEILFSVDGGSTFARPEDLIAADQNNEAQPVEPVQYEAIRWRVAEIPQGAEGSAGFSVTVQ